MSKLEEIKDFWQKAEIYSNWNPVNIGKDDIAWLIKRVERLEKFAILVSTAGVPNILKLQESAEEALAEEDE